MITLQKKPDGDFILLNLSDPQLSDGEWEDGHKNRLILEYTVGQLIKRTEPDLITVSGDLAWAGQTKSYRNLADLLDSYGVPWCCVWGNHDNQGGAEYVDSIVDYYLTKSNFVYERGEPSLGNGNYTIIVKSGEETAAGIILMDSHDRMPYLTPKGKEESGWAKLIPEQIEWYKEQVGKLESIGCRDSILIMHIPIFAYRTALDAAYIGGTDRDKISPIDSALGKGWKDGYKSSYGVTYESICSYPLDDGVFGAIKELGHTRLLIAGHDHVNNTVVDYEGVKFVYSLKCGAGCYWRPVLNGGTVVRIGDHGIRDCGHAYVDVTFLM